MPVPQPDRIIRTRPLTREAFAPFGQVIETAGAHHYPINAGNCERFHDLAKIELAGPAARSVISLMQAHGFALPYQVSLVERHPLGSQAFYPVSAQARYAVVVAQPGNTVRPEDLRAFIAAPGQGVNYRPGVWHHVLLPLERQTDFIVVDRGGPGHNCDEFHFEAGMQPVLSLA